MRDITFGDSLEDIGESAFEQCTSLSNVDIPDTVASIGKKAFYSCSGIYSVTLGSGVLQIGENAFYNCIRLIRVCNLSSLDIKVGDTRSGYVGFYALEILSEKSGILIESDEDGFVFYIGNSIYLIGYEGDSTELVLPTSYKGESFIMRENAFCGIEAIKKVTVNGISLSKGAFESCVGLESVTVVGEGVEIGVNAFYGCTSLQEVSIGTGVISIGYSAFADCTSLRELTVPGNVVKIGSYAFSGCTSLERIELEEGIVEIGSRAFSSMGALEIVMPNSVKTLGSYLFEKNKAIKRVVLGTGIKEISLGMFYGCTALEEVVISESVKQISQDAFRLCGLKKLFIPENVTVIQPYAFGNNSNIVIYCEVSSHPLGWNGMWRSADNSTVKWGSTKEDYELG